MMYCGNTKLKLPLKVVLKCGHILYIMFIIKNISLSACLGGPFGNKWNHVAREWNQYEVCPFCSTEVDFFRMEQLIYYPIEIQELKKCRINIEIIYL